MSEMIVREATVADLPAVLMLYAQPDFNGDEALDVAGAEAVFRCMATYPFYRLYVVDIEGETVGTACLLVMDNIARRGRPSAIIESVVVRADMRGTGVGRALIGELNAIAAGQGCYKAMLSTSSTNPAVHGFYQDMGYRQDGIRYRLPLRDEGI